MKYVIEKKSRSDVFFTRCIELLINLGMYMIFQ